MRQFTRLVLPFNFVRTLCRMFKGLANGITVFRNFSTRNVDLVDNFEYNGSGNDTSFLQKKAQDTQDTPDSQDI